MGQEETMSANMKAFALAVPLSLLAVFLSWQM